MELNRNDTGLLVLNDWVQYTGSWELVCALPGLKSRAKTCLFVTRQLLLLVYGFELRCQRLVLTRLLNL